MSAPVPVVEIQRPKAAEALVVTRAMNLALVAPVVGAFFQLLLTHRVPSLGWVIGLLVVAFATDMYKTRTSVREVPAILGADGLKLADGFVGAADLESVELDGDVAWVTRRSGLRHELRVTTSTDVSPVVESLRRAIEQRSSSRNDAAEELLAELDAMAVRVDVSGRDAYRGFGVDVARCLALAEDAGAPPKVRVAAVRLLADHPERDVRARVASVVESTACSELREAAEAVQAVAAPSGARWRSRG